MALLDGRTLRALLNWHNVLANDYDYITGVIADATSEVVSYLGYDPALQVVTGEEGYIERDSSGIYRGLYRLQTKVAPFIPGTAAQVFSSLQLLFARATLVTAPADLTYVTLEHPYGRAFLSPGAMQFLQGVSLETDGPFGSFKATSYQASYVAGWATSINDPTLPGNVSYGAAPIPAAITQAAVLLCRERLAMDGAQNKQTTNVGAGNIYSRKTGSQTITYQATNGANFSGLGYGSVLAQAAASRLNRYRRLTLG